MPGGQYDLIHVDGQQDGTGSFNDLRKAMRQAKYILVDGYFWTRDNFLHVSEFLHKYRDLIESYMVIPGYAGELLITPKVGLNLADTSNNSQELKHTYTSSYYLSDCGGFDAYKRDKGMSMSDGRLGAVGSLAEAVPPGRALDLGCGRGELSVFLACLGNEVLAIDYSPQAIELAREAAVAAGPSLDIEFYCGDVQDAPLTGTYNVVTASDLVEHMAPAELDSLYQRIALHLMVDGLFIIHTFPNSWSYKFEHPRRVRQARQLGAYLPSNPRSRFEELMHINEQSPAVLKRQLKAHFEYVTIWFADHDLTRPFENLNRPFSRGEMRAAGDLFAVASHSPIDVVTLRSKLEQQPVCRPLDMKLEILEIPSQVRTGSLFQANVAIKNESNITLKSRGPNPIHLSYHCYTETGEVVVFDGIRSRLPLISSLSKKTTALQIQAPVKSGKFRFRLTFVQEMVCWFDGPPDDLFVDAWVEVAD